MHKMKQNKGKMKLLISGSREATTEQDAQRLTAEIEKRHPTTLLHGGAQGADQIAHTYAQTHQLPEVVRQPNYKRYAKTAPHKRNDELIDMSEKVLCYYATNYPEKTPGTASVAQKAKRAGKLIAEIWRDHTTQEQQTIQTTLW
jgi:YspA, cpYpsA-related SLOG family